MRWTDGLALGIALGIVAVCFVMPMKTLNILYKKSNVVAVLAAVSWTLVALTGFIIFRGVTAI